MLFLRQSTVRLASQVRRSSVVSGPPSNKLSKIEKAAHGIFISICCLATPAYVLVNLPKYKGLE